MSAQLVREMARDSGLLCVAQEELRWFRQPLNADCFSVFTLPDSRWARLFARRVNRRLPAEAGNLERIATVYPLR